MFGSNKENNNVYGTNANSKLINSVEAAGLPGEGGALANGMTASPDLVG